MSAKTSSVDMDICTRTVASTLMCLLCVTTALAQESNQQIVTQRLKTLAGEVRVRQLDPGPLGHKYDVTLDNNVILHTDGDSDDESSRFYLFPVITVLEHFTKPIAPFDEVILFQQNMWGNMCEGGPLWFLGLKRDGSFHISGSIDFCGGRPPIVTEGVNKVVIVIPGGPPNRLRGYIPAQTWAYEHGEVREIATTPQRRR